MKKHIINPNHDLAQVVFVLLILIKDLPQVVFVLLRGTREALAQRAEDNKLVVTLHCGESHKEGQTKCRFIKRVLSSVHVPELTGDNLDKRNFLKHLLQAFQKQEGKFERVS